MKDTKNSKKSYQNIQSDSLYIRGILAYLNQIKKVSTKQQLIKAVHIANNIDNVSGYFFLENLEIQYKEW